MSASVFPRRQLRACRQKLSACEQMVFGTCLTESWPTETGELISLKPHCSPPARLQAGLVYETSMAAVILDFGDIQMLRALLHAVVLGCYTINSYNFSIQLNALYSLFYSRSNVTTEGLLADYPLALTFATSNDFQAARLSFENGVERYLAASKFIRGRPTNITRLFNYDAQQAADEARFRQTLVELRDSLHAPVVLSTNGTNRVSIDLGNYFNGTTPLRSFFPEFRGK